jgi:hypothetical protein
MLSLPEKFIFILAVFISLYFTWLGVERIVRIMGRGQGKPVWNLGLRRLGLALAKTITLQPTFQLRPGPSLFHAFVGWGFMFYILVNLGDLLQAYIPVNCILVAMAFSIFRIILPEHLEVVLIPI